MLNTTMKERTIDIIIEAKNTLEAKEFNCEVWETKCDEAYMEMITCEDLIFYYDTPEMSKRLAKAYNRSRHYNYIYHKIAKECEALEKAIEALEKANYWL